MKSKQPLKNCIITKTLPILTYQEALRNAEDLKQDVHALKVRYKLGFISKRDYESSLIQLEASKLKYIYS